MLGRTVDTIRKIDESLDRKISKKRFPLGIQAMESLTSLGSIYFSLLILVFLWRFGHTDAARLLGISYLAAWMPVYSLKHLVKRERPENHIGHLIGRTSFPSGHSATAFTSAILLSDLYGRETVFISLAATVAFSRIYLEDHYLSDVITGSLIGIAVGLLIV
ncbi:MAG: phosphatase PAP2 family protein [Candidatus Nanohaloarchaea archaeon]